MISQSDDNQMIVMAIHHISDYWFIVILSCIDST